MTPAINPAGLVCPFCGSSDLDFPRDLEEGAQPPGPAYCYSCNAYQDADREWVRPDWGGWGTLSSAVGDPHLTDGCPG